MKRESQPDKERQRERQQGDDGELRGREGIKRKKLRKMEVEQR